MILGTKVYKPWGLAILILVMKTHSEYSTFSHIVYILIGD